MLKAIDTPNDTAGHAHALKSAGIEAVALYLRSDRASRAMVEGLAAVGIKRVSVFERGHPDHPVYFTSAQAAHDASAAVAFARSIGQTAGSQIFFAVDYDAQPADLTAIEAYFRQAQQIVKQAGFLCSVYGSGLVCGTLIGKGLAHSGWLAQSRGWTGFDGYRSKAAIVQGKEDTLILRGERFDIDWDTVVDPGVCW